MNKGLIVVIVALALGLWHVCAQKSKIQKEWETAVENVKSYNVQLSTEKSKSTALKLTIEQLKYYQDSILKALDQTRKELKVKDKNLKALQLIKSSYSKADTVLLRDTIFKEPSLAIDTLLGDEWYNVRLGLRYPSTITIHPKFKSEKHIVVSTRKETVNPPKKFFLARWFQKKHTVLQVDVVEQNPHVEGETSKYIEVLK